MVINARKEFIELISSNCKVHGFDDLSAKTIAILFLEPKEISLEELSKKTGYSLSGTSTSMKFMERAGMIKKIKKPKSKKVYFFMEKDFLTMFNEMFKKKYEHIILPTKEKLPLIVKKYKRSKKYPHELEFIKGYYQQILMMEKVTTKIFQLFNHTKI